jgi:hypothetical protein
MEFSTMGNQVKVELSWDETSVDFGPWQWKTVFIDYTVLVYIRLNIT